jgi:hypothetical protein
VFSRLTFADFMLLFAFGSGFWGGILVVSFENSDHGWMTWQQAEVFRHFR